MMWDCAECIRDGKQLQRGCEATGRVMQGEVLEIDGVIHQHCPCRSVTNQSLAWVEEAMLVRALGMAPEPGGLNDQGNREIEALAMVLASLAPHE